MDAMQGVRRNEKLAQAVQSALRKHEVDPTQIGSTVYFLSEIIGAIHTVVLPNKSVTDVLEMIKDEIEYGMEMGIPEE